LGDGLVGELDNNYEIKSAEVATQLFKNLTMTLFLPHPTRAMPRKELPKGFIRSYFGFLIRNHHREIEVDQDIVK
jgi:hypothetical protein